MPAPLPETLREKAIKKLIEILTLAEAPAPLTGLLFTTVLRGPLDADMHSIQLPAVGVEEGDEDLSEFIGNMVHKQLSLYIDFKFENQLGVDAYEAFNYYAGIVTKAVMADTTLSGRCLDLQVTNCTTTVEGRADPVPGGNLVVSMSFRHRNGDPFIR